MPLLQECLEHFKTDCLYKVFHIERSATASAVKKAYYKLSMICHPDKAGNDESTKQEATFRFQLVSKVYAILSDKEKRSVYDETGAVDDEDVISDEDSVNLWRKVFKKVTKEDIDKFFADYKGSQDEEEDIIAAYDKCNGDFNVMLEYINISASDDEGRIKEIVDRLVSDGTLKSTKKYKTSTTKSQTASRAKKAAKEAKEAEEALKEIEGREGSNDLQALILKRQADRGNGMDSFLDSLAAQYAPKQKKTKK